MPRFKRCHVICFFPNGIGYAFNRIKVHLGSFLLSYGQWLFWYISDSPIFLISSYVLGDKSILKDAGLEEMKDVEALPPPPEIKDNLPAQKYRGDVSYFICTRLGRGPVVLMDECQALLNPETGLPM